jgi:hypothetical protein
LALILTASVPALAVEDTRFVTVADPAGDLPSYGGTKIDRAEYAGLDLRRVRQRILDDRLVVVAKYRDLTKRNTRTNPDRTPIGASMSMFALYLDSHRRVSSHGLLYTASFGRDRQVELTRDGSVPVACEGASRRSTIDLEHDRVRYVVPVTCLPDLAVVHTTAQVIRYKVMRRTADGTEHLNMLTLDQNTKPLPALVLR